jgi:hypothetical protein
MFESDFISTRIIGMGNASKPITFAPLKFKDAVSALLKVKPEPKQPKAKKKIQKMDK